MKAVRLLFLFCCNVNGNNFRVETDAECRHRYVIGATHSFVLVAGGENGESKWPEGDGRTVFLFFFCHIY